MQSTTFMTIRHVGEMVCSFKDKFFIYFHEILALAWGVIDALEKSGKMIALEWLRVNQVWDSFWSASKLWTTSRLHRSWMTLGRIRCRCSWASWGDMEVWLSR